MQRTGEYRAETDEARAGAVAWLQRRDRWDRRLRVLEGAPAAPLLTTEPAAHPTDQRRVAAR